MFAQATGGVGRAGRRWVLAFKLNERSSKSQAKAYELKVQLIALTTGKLKFAI